MFAMARKLAAKIAGEETALYTNISHIGAKGSAKTVVLWALKVKKKVLAVVMI